MRIAHQVSQNFQSFCDLFRSQVSKNPEAIAVVFEENSLSYAELDKRSSQLANFLEENNVKSESIVALSLHNSIELLVGMLGIIKSGGVYLPIDPNYPKERIESIIRDSNPVLVLTEDKLKSLFLSFPCKVALVTEIPYSDLIHKKLIKPDHAAYVIYTSGSTGKPKGIVMEHRALSHAALCYQKLHPDRLVSLVAGSISFDAGLLVISHTLSLGGMVCIPKNESVVDPQYFIELIQKHSINYTLCVPSFYLMILSKSRKLPSLLCVDLGGDTLPNELPALHAEIAPNAILHNVYGPSEYAVGATFEKIYDPANKRFNRISIGIALPNTQVYILDESLKEVAPGIKGEIYIGGEGLARGYLNRDVLTNERFLWVTFLGRSPIRLYKTGDFGRFLSNGNIEFLGRMDHQVKIRGYRVEMGEVEHAISQYPDVKEVVVMAQEGQLIAYFCSKNEISKKLRIYLQDILPQYMVPSAFVQIESWPLTPNGKIDRNALVAPLKGASFERPLSEMERTLFQIWKQVLGNDRFGTKDNFFELGGDSLQIVNVQTILEEAIGKNISIAVLFQYPTISQLANYLSTDEAVPQKNHERREKQKSAFQHFKKFHNRE